MGKIVYVVRHCQATGQDEDAELTEVGYQQAKDLVGFFEGIQIDQIISSPFIRAQQTIQALANERSLSIQFDERLGERVLSTEDLPDWREKLQATFSDPYLTFQGGESSAEAAKRILRVIEELDERSPTVIVTHGNIMALLLREFDKSFGFNEWEKLSNPDVFELVVEDERASFKRIWQDEHSL